MKRDSAMTTKSALTACENAAQRLDLKGLYQRMFPVVARYVAKRGGAFEEAKDIFHDAVLVYFEKIVLGMTVSQNNDAAYLFGIARHLWTKRYRQNLRQASLDELMAEFEMSDADMDWPADVAEAEMTAATSKRLVRVLHAAGQRCMDLLTAFYYEKLDMQELAHRFGFSGTRSATVQKFKCLQKVKEVVKEKSLQYEDFVG